MSWRNPPPDEPRDPTELRAGQELEQAIKCPYCHHIHTGTSQVAKDAGEPDLTPEAGDISLCIQCGHPSQFTREGTLGPIEGKPLIELMTDRSYIKSYWAYLQARASTIAEGKPWVSTVEPEVGTDDTTTVT